MNRIITAPEIPTSEKLIIPNSEVVQELPRMGEILVENGLITSKQLETALSEQKKSSQYIGVILMRHNWIPERELLNHLGRQRNVEFYNVHDMEIPLEIHRHIPRELAIKYQVLPIAVERDKLFVATEDPFNKEMIGKLEDVANISVNAGFAVRSDLQYALNRIYNNLLRANKNIRDFYDGFAYLLDKTVFDADMVIDLYLALGYLLKASDIHLTFGIEDFYLGVRIDGKLHSIPLPARRLTPKHISHLRNRMMIKANVNVSELAQPQKGMLELLIDNTSVKARLASFPLVQRCKNSTEVYGKKTAAFH